MANEKPEAPEVGKFQVAEWDAQNDQWWIRDKTEAELYRDNPPFDSWTWSDADGDWVAPEPKPDPNAAWDEGSLSWTPGSEVLAARIPDIRKQVESEGVTVNGVLYQGDSETRQALNEALQFADQAGMTTFDYWKGDDGVFRADHPVSDVRDALNQIGARRQALFALEAQHTESVVNGTVTDLATLSWTV